MMDRQIGPAWIGGCIVVALVVAAASTAAFKLLATPSDYVQRLAVVEQKVLRAERLGALPSARSTYPKGAVCEGLTGPAFNDLRQRLEEAASTEGLPGMQVVWGEPLVAGGRIAPVPLSLRVQGPYEKVASLMDRLSRSAPKLFVDAADLTASDAGVQLDLSGKVFCWTRG